MKTNRIWPILFGLYCTVMLWLLFNRTGYVEGIPYTDQMRINLIPFRTIRLFADLLNHPRFRWDAVVNLGGNVILFIPLGFLLPKVFPKLDRLGKVLLVTAGIIVVVELAQLFTLLGSCDTDDLILNVIGSAIGYGVYYLTVKKRLS